MAELLKMKKLAFNPSIKLAISDADDTISPVYTPVNQEMVDAINQFIEDGRSLFIASGASLENITKNITSKFKPINRSRILISHCSGAELWGFDKNGELITRPFYSLYQEKLNTSQQKRWREIVKQIEDEFSLVIYPSEPTEQFKITSKGDKNSVMKEDRGPQITWEFVNSPELRDEIIPMISLLLKENKIPVTPRKGGLFALDLALKDVSKDYSIKYIFENPRVLEAIQLNMDLLEETDRTVEIWGDRFMEGKGSDQHMSIALPPKVRSLNFRPDEDPNYFPKGYNIQLWNGDKKLSEGLLEYLLNR